MKIKHVTCAIDLLNEQIPLLLLRFFYKNIILFSICFYWYYDKNSLLRCIFLKFTTCVNGRVYSDDDVYALEVVDIALWNHLRTCGFIMNDDVHRI